MNWLAAFSGIVCLTVVSLSAALAQNPAITPSPTPAAVDSTRRSQSATDTIPSSVRRNGIRVSTGVPADSSVAIDDTTQVTPKQEAAIRKIIPRKATFRSLMLPGLGQAYNRQYYKIPFIYAGFGAVGYFFVRYRGLANEAETGYRQLLYGDADGTKVTEVVIGTGVFRSSAQAKSAYDFYRRYRDMNIILAVVIYAVNAVEANVAAHLKTFDLSDDISMRVEPTVLPMPGTGLVPGIRVAWTFK
jgi:Family of unknown function (DUF5683)